MPFALVLNRNRQARLEESPAFAHVAERFRRAGDLQRAVSLCRDGLRRFPDHVSARVTLGLALVDLNNHADARKELKHALKLAPDNLAAIRGMAHLHDHGDHDLGEPLPAVKAAAFEPAPEPDFWRALEPEPEPEPAPAPIRAPIREPIVETAAAPESALDRAFASLEELDPVMPPPELELEPLDEIDQLDPIDLLEAVKELDAAHDGPDDIESDDDVDPAVRAYREALPIGCVTKELDPIAIGLEMESLPPESLPPYDVGALERFLSQVQTHKLINA
jgi:tetratricopeptide (TPR) repeat protein